MRMEWEGLLQDQVLLKELTMFGIYKDASGRWGEIPVSSQAELKSIALEEVEEIQSNAFSWIDPTQQWKPKISEMNLIII
jgi:hypothetical protein